MTIGWALLSAAVPKALGGWFDPSRQDTRGYIATDVATGDKLGPLGAWMLPFDFDPFWKLMDLRDSPAVRFVDRFRLYAASLRCWMLLLACFHVGVYLTSGICVLGLHVGSTPCSCPVVMWVARRARRGATRPAGEACGSREGQRHLAAAPTVSLPRS